MNLLKKLMGEYIHTALIFNEGSVYYTSDAKYGEYISWSEGKEFKKDGWVVQHVVVTKQQYTIIKNYCLDANRRKAGYNTKGQYLCLTPFAEYGDGKEEKYTCPELIVHAFHKAHLMLDLAPSATTPHDLLNAVQGYNNIVTATPNKKKYQGKLSTKNIDVSLVTVKKEEDNKFEDMFNKFL